jgi:hypothetical protein
MPAGVSAYVALANVTINTSGVSSLTFSSISQSYRDLILIGQVGNTGTTGFGGVFNGDNGSNYSYIYASGDGSSPGSGAASSQAVANFGANAWSTGSLDLTYVIHLMDYSATDKHKTFLARADGRSGSTSTSMNAGRWANTAAITSVRIQGLGSSNFVSGSTFALYGIAS